MIDQLLGAAGLKLKLTEFSLQSIQLYTLFAGASSIRDGVCHRLAGGLPAASLSECLFNLAASSVIFSSDFLTLPRIRLVFSLVLARSDDCALLGNKGISCDRHTDFQMGV